MLGKLGHFLEKGGKCEVWDKIASEGARTVPGRENGGNCDIKNLSRGCTVWFPVFVPGALLSMGDMHMSQGDGEVSFCGAIEMAGKKQFVYRAAIFMSLSMLSQDVPLLLFVYLGFLDLKCSVIKGENTIHSLTRLPHAFEYLSHNIHLLLSVYERWHEDATCHWT
jgi:hypothetical protein